MKALHRLSLVVAGFMALSSSAHANSVLVGTDPSTSFAAGGLCPAIRNCQADVQSFTLHSQVTITDIQVVMEHSSYSPFGPDGHFSVGLVDKPVTAFTSLPSNVLIGSGELPYGPDWQDLSKTRVVSELFDFSGLDITLDPGTYYLEFAGEAVGPARATTSLSTTAGTFGQTFFCDPTVNPQTCNDPSRWQSFSSSYDADPFAVTINGNVVAESAVVPEPSSWLLLATGVVGATGMSRRIFNRHSR